MTKRSINKKKTIVIPASRFCAWNGGIKFVKTFTDSVISFDKKEYFNYLLLIPDNNLISSLKRAYFIIKNFLHSVIKGKITIADWSYSQGSKELREYFSQKDFKNFEIKGIDTLEEKKYLDNKDTINVLSFDLGSAKNKIGYLYDFQHKNLPNLFVKEETEYRDKNFKEILNKNSDIIVNSKQTKKDAYKFFKKFNSKIHVLPFCPYLDFKINNLLSLRTKNRYFIICNQFWKHKNFETAIKAMVFFKDKDIKLKITGEYKNVKNLDYFFYIKSLSKKLGIENNIEFLGNINKKKQIQLILNSIALIQPSLSEGGPGGYSSYEAISLGKPLIASKTSINLEMKGKNIFFFKKKNQKDLYKKMLYLFNKKTKKINLRQIENSSKINKKKLGREIFKILKIFEKKKYV